MHLNATNLPAITLTKTHINFPIDNTENSFAYTPANTNACACAMTLTHGQTDKYLSNTSTNNTAMIRIGKQGKILIHSKLKKRYMFVCFVSVETT